jgi:hypothetical protein
MSLYGESLVHLVFSQQPNFTDHLYQRLELPEALYTIHKRSYLHGHGSKISGMKPIRL